MAPHDYGPFAFFVPIDVAPSIKLAVLEFSAVFALFPIIVQGAAEKLTKRKRVETQKFAASQISIV